MLTITRNTNGDVDIIYQSGNQINLPNGNVGFAADPNVANAVLIVSPFLVTTPIKGQLSVLLTDISLINGSAPPATLTALITLLGDLVFFRKATVGGGTLTYTQDASSTPLTKTQLNVTYGAYKHGDIVFVATANVKYLKTDDINPGGWDSQPYNPTT